MPTWNEGKGECLEKGAEAHASVECSLEKSTSSSFDVRRSVHWMIRITRTYSLQLSLSTIEIVVIPSKYKLERLAWEPMANAAMNRSACVG